MLPMQDNVEMDGHQEGMEGVYMGQGQNPGFSEEGYNQRNQFYSDKLDKKSRNEKEEPKELGMAELLRKQ